MRKQNPPHRAPPAATALSWRQVANGVWVGRAGKPPALTLLAAATARPRRGALARMRRSAFPLERDGIVADTAAGRTVLRLPLAPAEALYGLGLNFRRLDVRGTVRHLHVDHYGHDDNGRTHAPVPFYVSSRGYGVLVNAARYVSVYAGNTHRRERHPPLQDRLTPGWTPVLPGPAVEIAVPEAGVELVVFAGPTLREAVCRFNLYCGGGCLPPRWGLGFWHRVPMGYTAAQVEAEVAEFADRGFPLDVIGLEPGWHSQCYPTSCEWSAARFPDPAGFMRRLAAAGVRVNLWENSFLVPDSPLGRRLARHSGSHTGSWGGLVPDLLQPGVRRAIARQHEREHLARGASGYKLDECDGFDVWLWPDHATFPSGASGEQMRQVYAVLLQRLTTELFRRRNQRTYGLARGANAGSVRFPYVLYSDCYSHRDFIAALCSSSLCGTLWTPEARSSRSAEEWLRRMQAVCLSPLAMINAWADGTKPWSWPEVEDAVRDVMQLRQRLLPYLYSAFARYHEDGLPPFRAMVFEAAGNPNAAADPALAGANDQFMVGDCLLVAPLFAGEPERRVLFPAGQWFDFYSGQQVSNGAPLTVPAAQRDIPIFVRDGGIVPLLPGRRQVPAPGEAAPLEIRHYGHAAGGFRLYEDDGLTFAYERGGAHWRELRADRTRRGVWRGSATPARHGVSCYGRLTWKFMTP